MKKIILALMCLYITNLSWGQEKVAIFNPAGEVNNSIKTIIREELSSAVVSSNNYTVLERALIDKVLEESKFQMSGQVDDNQIGELGKKMGADYVCIASITPMGNNFYLSFKLVSVTTAKVERQKTGMTQRGGNELMPMSVRLANEMFQEKPNSNLSISSIQTEESTTTSTSKLTMHFQKFKKGKPVILEGGKQVNLSEVTQKLSTNRNLLKEYDKGVALRKASRWVMWGGIVAGAALYSYGYYEGYDFPPAIGIAVFSSSIVSSIVLKAISKSKVEKSIEGYNSSLHASIDKPTLNYALIPVSSNNRTLNGLGVGLTLNF